MSPFASTVRRNCSTLPRASVAGTGVVVGAPVPVTAEPDASVAVVAEPDAVGLRAAVLVPAVVPVVPIVTLAVVLARASGVGVALVAMAAVVAALVARPASVARGV